MIWKGINSITEISIAVCSSRCDLPDEQQYMIKINDKENKIVKDPMQFLSSSSLLESRTIETQKLIY
jgi:hypothetical protein